MLNIKKINMRFSAVFVSMVVLFVTVFALSFSTAHADNLNVNYKVYNAKTGAYLRQYDLSVVGNNTRKVIGDDERELDYSKNGVVKIITTDGQSRYLSSGFVVDEHTIGTAAHCVENQKIVSILFFDSNGNNCMTITDPVEYHFPSKYPTYSKRNENPYDYALITVKQSLKDYQCFQFGMITDDFQNSKYNVTSIAGFPGVVRGQTVNTSTKHALYRSTGKVVGTAYEDSENISIIKYTDDSSGGNSGGPLYVTEQCDGILYYTVIGVHVRRGNDNENFNEATAISPSVLKFYRGNSNKEY